MKMQRNKGNNSLSEISSYFEDFSLLADIFRKLLGGFDLRYINSLFSQSKKRGVEGKGVFQTLFLLQFLDFDNIHQLILSGISKEFHHKKDVFYDFMKNPRIDWRRILGLFSKQTLKILIQKAEEQTTPKFLIVDDTLYEKTGRKIEFIGKVFDHSTHIFKLGMKVLTLGYTDGKTFIPLNFSIHNEPGKNGKRGLKAKDLKTQYTKKRALDSPGYQRESEVSKDKISVSLQMITLSQNKGIKADYVLADSWFIGERFIRGVKTIDENMEVIGLMKMNRKITINGKGYKANTIPEIKRKDIHYSSKLKCHYISMRMLYKEIEMRGFWVRMNGQNTWKLLISTDIKLTFIKAMRYYQNRWAIEVFFRDCKQNLGLENCQSTDLDAHVASISIVFMNYMVLALKKRFEDYETLGMLFRDFKEIMLKQTIIQRIWELLFLFFDSFLVRLNVEWERFISEIINNQQIIENQIEKTFSSLFSVNLSYTKE